MFFTYQQPNFDTALTELKTLLEEAQRYNNLVRKS